MRRVSLNQRLAGDATSSGQIEAILLEISHPALDKPLRLSTDNTERLSVDPVIFGTRSTWRGADPATEPFLWLIASALVPSDLEDAPSAGTIVLEVLDPEIVVLLRSFVDRATLAMAVVLASSPSMIEAEWSDMPITSAEITATEITIEFSREEIEAEYYPTGRMTRSGFPGLFL